MGIFGSARTDRMADTYGRGTRWSQSARAALAVPADRGAAAVVDRGDRASRNRRPPRLACGHARSAAAVDRHAGRTCTARCAVGAGDCAVPGRRQPIDAWCALDVGVSARCWTGHRRTHALSLHRGDRRWFFGDADVARRPPRAARHAGVVGGRAWRIRMAAAAVVESR